MINRSEILQTIAMIDQQHLDIRTITMGISLLDCADTDITRSCTKVYDKICRLAGRLVRTGEDIEAEFGIPIVNKRVSVTPISLVAAGTGARSYVPYAQALDRAAHEIGINFLGGFSALVQKGMTESDRVLIASIPEALARTELVCSSVNVGSTRAGINMDAVAEMGRTVKRAAALTADQGVMASSHVGGLSGAFIPVSEDAGMIAAAEAGRLTIEKLEAMTCVCSVGLDMIAVPGDTTAETISAIIADEAAIGMINNKTTAVRIIPAPGKTVGDTVAFGGLLGSAPVMPVNRCSAADFIARGGRIPAPLHSLKN